MKKPKEQFELGDIVWVLFEEYVEGQPDELRVGKVIELPQISIEYPDGRMTAGWRYYGVKLAGDEKGQRYDMDPKTLSRATTMDWKAAELIDG